MLPVRLELRNFLAYQEPPAISFEGLSLACLTGPNGAGKSSLLDAMTWALWGRARGQSDDDLIHMGHDEMSVKFTFRQDQNLFRIVRQRTKRGRGQSFLELANWNEESDEWIVISEATIRETQNRITQLLRLDYETFVHSAFLQQGKADSFTIETPARRKRILAEILGLSRWEQFEALAKEQLSGVDEQLNVIRIQIEEIEAEETRGPDLLTKCSQAAEKLQGARQALEEAEQRLAEVSGAREKKQETQKQLETVREQIKHCERELEDLTVKVSQQKAKLEESRQIVERQQVIVEGYNRFAEARGIADELGDKLLQQGELKDQLNEFTRQLAAERSTLEAQIGVHQKFVVDAEQATAAIAQIETELEALNAELYWLDGRKAELQAVQANRETLNAEDATLRSENKTLKTEMDDIRKRLDMVEAADGAVCPVCGQELDERHRLELTEQYQSEGRHRGDRYRDSQVRMADIKRELTQSEGLLREIEADLGGLDARKAKQGALEERWTAAQQVAQHRDEEQAALDDKLRRLAGDDFGLEIRERIAEVQQEMDNVGYDRDAHSEAREALQSLRSYDAQMRELEIAIERLPDLESYLNDLESRHERLITDREAYGQQAARLTAEVETLQQQVEEAIRRQVEVNRYRILEREANSELIGVQQQLKAIDDARKRKAELERRREALLQDRSIYEQLREAFGKNGIPAMMIEAAIPELEEATNKLLTRMTDGRMNVRFDTQRANKTGDGVRETLDIVISDELGTRDYSLFSGGEGFRVNFALRIALSQFLARRAGARLQTLVIDEGFGSQDDIGRERLVEAINAIRGEFDLILIVTHLDDLRDAFPVQIEVRKTPNGSTVAIV